MTATRQDQAPVRRGIPRVVAASVFGTALEWYDFLLFGLAAAVVFDKLFFPSFDQATGTLLSLSTFTVGFVARPFGGVLFGHMGDRVGRKRVLFLTLCLMGVATLLIGALPTYASIGLWAPVLLVLLRFVQGLGAGGEFGGAVLMLAESAETGRRGLLASLAQAGAPAGNLLATGVLALFTAVLPDDAFLTWGWRVPFLLSALLVFVGLYVRMGVAESPSFQQVEHAGAKASWPVLEVLRKHPRALLVALGLRFGPDVAVYVFLTFVLTYLTQYVGVERGTALVAVTLGSVAWLVAIPTAGWLSDRVGRVRLYTVGTCLAVVWVFAFFPLLGTGSLALMSVAVAVGLAIHGLMFGPQAGLLAELFPAAVRSSGVSVGYQLSGVYGGSLAPVIAVALLGRFDSWLPISLYMLATLLVTLVALRFSPERSRQSLDAG